MFRSFDQRLGLLIGMAVAIALTAGAMISLAAQA